jgi:hypothetical protein
MLKKGEIYELEGMFREKLGAAHGYLWVYEGKANLTRYGIALRLTREFVYAWLAEPAREAFRRESSPYTRIKGERKWGTFKSVASGHVMNMPTFAVVVERWSLLRKILRWIRWINS